MAAHRGMVGNGDSGSRGTCGDYGRCHTESGGGRDADIARKVRGIHREALAATRAVNRERRYGCCQLCKSRCIGSRGIVGKVGNVGVEALETELCLGKTAHAGKAGVVDLEGTHRGSPRGTLQIHAHADLLRVGLGLEVGSVLLVAVACHGNRHRVVGVLKVIDAQRTQGLAAPHATAGQGREAVDLVGGNIHYLRNLTGCPTIIPHVAVHREDMVVLVNLVVTLLSDNLLSGIVLVVRIHVPTLDAGHDVAASAEVPLALEIAVLKKVLLDAAALNAPLRLKGQVGKAEGVNGYAVAVHEHALVGRHSIAVGMIEAVGVVERAAVARVADTLVTDERVRTVIEAKAGVPDIALETHTVAGKGIGVEHRTRSIGAGLHLDGIARGGIKRRRVEGHGLAAAAVDGAARDVLHGKGSAVADKVDITAHVTAAENQATFLPGEARQMSNGDCNLFIYSCRNHFWSHSKSTSDL